MKNHHLIILNFLLSLLNSFYRIILFQEIRISLLSFFYLTIRYGCVWAFILVLQTILNVEKLLDPIAYQFVFLMFTIFIHWFFWIRSYQSFHQMFSIQKYWTSRSWFGKLKSVYLILAVITLLIFLHCNNFSSDPLSILILIRIIVSLSFFYFYIERGSSNYNQNYITNKQILVFLFFIVFSIDYFFKDVLFLFIKTLNELKNVR